jgi:hypothetical protein
MLWYVYKPTLLLLSLIAATTINSRSLHVTGVSQDSLAAMGPPVTGNEQLVVGAEIIKPACDKLSYRALQLPNKLRVLLIHDSDTDKAAAALDVSGACRG